MRISIHRESDRSVTETIEVFQSSIEPMVLLDPPDVVYGVGSAEGLMRQLSNHSQLLIAVR